MRAIVATLIVLGSLAGAASAGAAAGDLDPSFSEDGKLTTALSRDSAAGAVIARPDGTLIVAGSNYNFNYLGISSFSAGFVARYRADGELDPSFGANGVTEFSFDGRNGSSVAAMAVRPDGSLVLVGVAVGYESSGPIAMDPHLGVALVKPSGELDSSFGAAAMAAVDSFDPAAPSVAAFADGSVAIGGRAGGDLAVARLRADGTPDSSFSGDGIQTADLGGDSDGVAALAADGDALLAAGNGDNGAAVLRYQSSGAPDPAFGTGGVARPPAADFGAGTIDLRPSGEVVIGGGTPGDRFGAHLAVVQLRADGTADPAFSDDGAVVLRRTSARATADLAVAPDGRLLLVDGANGDFAVIRLNADGTSDRAFGRRGVAVTDLGGNYDASSAIAVQADGRIVAAGRRERVIVHSDTSSIALARYLVAGRHDADADGVVDRRDRCPYLYAPRGARGCPEIGRRIEVEVDRGLVTGRIRADRRDCAARERVVAVVAGGGKRVVARARTRGSGKFTLSDRLPDGEYRIRAPAHVDRAVGLCRAARSSAIDV